ncbi:RuvC-like Holliday junction resolvase [Gordonia phage Rofo]|uniref:RuvC-like resolvase n=4 Tax=Vividuovirus TaxID=2560251 RepID=A0A3G3MAN5_9CAUD|nr:RuvC-like Holliday junction resolvase [Gordonia phage Brandonk123]YP_010096861.1 RuvC-like Holliday junction resolvase [Gordonia phage Rofo]YP_010099314.1 RuvC-like Holliday junction resolvase [Gordonia phage Fosterous]YP_010099650.1 RuvC-like Holliday junction resolvase [Gordonia phage Tangent]QDH92712.1 RuvC-like resolvase [Gordonia phage Charming]AUX81909.1 RuvC-like resolvase [Gordonia phage Brandonk123]AXH46646.1 RuvC-like resolvase [Gordonia phage Rofo]AYR02790.1 RuvC-like resolvase
MTVILGVDPSLTSTGLCRITITPPTVVTSSGGVDDVSIQTTCVGEPGSKGMTVEQRRARIQRARRSILRAAQGVDLAVIEVPFYNRKTTQVGLMDRSWLWGTVVDGLHAADIPVVHVAAKQRAKFATDNGNADKAQVAEAIGRLWSQVLVENGRHRQLRNDDEYDALVCATIGAVKTHPRSRLPIRVLEHHLHVVAGLDWQAWDTSEQGITW